MKNKIIIISILIVAVATILMALNLTSGKPNQQKNGFDRMFTLGDLTRESGARFNIEFTDICGISNDSLFLSCNIPGRVYLANLSLGRLDTFALTIPLIPKISSVLYTRVNYPELTMIGGNARCIIRGNLQTGHYDTVSFSDLTTGPFSKIQLIDNDRFVARMIDNEDLNTSFIKIDISNRQIAVKEDLLPLLGDAGFIYDGILNYDSSTQKLVFVCFYNNVITCFDTSLNLIYKSRTIDTIGPDHVNVAHKKTSITHKTPPITNNAQSCVFDGQLYVRSKLQAQNENNDEFNDNAVIDVYDMTNGQYKRSFYIPLPDGQKLKQFRMLKHNKLLALYNNSIAQYRLP